MTFDKNQYPKGLFFKTGIPKFMSIRYFTKKYLKIYFLPEKRDKRSHKMAHPDRYIWFDRPQPSEISTLRTLINQLTEIWCPSSFEYKQQNCAKGTYQTSHSGCCCCNGRYNISSNSLCLITVCRLDTIHLSTQILKKKSEKSYKKHCERKYRAKFESHLVGSAHEMH